jgi:hypothetical protein
MTSHLIYDLGNLAFSTTIIVCTHIYYKIETNLMWLFYCDIFVMFFILKIGFVRHQTIPLNIHLLLIACERDLLVFLAPCERKACVPETLSSIHLSFSGLLRLISKGIN